MAFDPRRFLGFAFANADLLLEADRDGTIAFAMGAVGEFTAKAELAGTQASDLFALQHATRFGAELRILEPGHRTTLKLQLQSGKGVQVAMFRLPEYGDRIACTLAIPNRTQFSAVATDAATGLASRESFLDSVVAKSLSSDRLTLVDIPALAKICAGLPPEKAKAVLLTIGQALQNSGAKAAGRLSDTRFGAVSDATAGAYSAAPHIQKAMASEGLPPTPIAESHMGLKAGNMPPAQRLLALRYAVDNFAPSNGALPDDLSRAFTVMIDETHKRIRSVTDTVATGAFELAYQPIVSLRNGDLSHYEALARFDGGKTGETIQFVEKLGIADSFDLAVALKVITALEADKSHDAHVAFNLSGHTIASPASFGMLAGLLARHRWAIPRLLIEITETAEITDLEQGAKAIAALRQMGFRVGLDDFGAGAATMAYLHAFEVDFVKFDGSLVKKLGKSPRDDLLLTSNVRLCHELGFSTIAECLETENDVARARGAGFDHGQGYYFGAAGRIASNGAINTPRQIAL